MKLGRRVSIPCSINPCASVASYTVPHCPSGTTSRGRSGGRVLAVIEDHARVQRRSRVHGFAADEIEKSGTADAREIRRHLVPTDVQLLQRGQRAERDHGERHSGRDGLDGRVLVEFRHRKTKYLGDSGMLVQLTECRFRLTHLAEEQAIALLEAHSDFADLQIEYDLIRIRVLAQVPGGAERGMSGEGQLFVHREDADLVAFPSLDGCVAGQNERCLGQIGFARELLHFAVAQATSIAEDRELIALERAAGKHIKLDKPKCTLGHRKAPHTYQDAERGGGAENILPPVVLLGSPLRKRRGSGDSPGLQNRRLAPCGVNGAFDSHTLPPIFSATCKLPHITADLTSPAAVACWLHKSSKAFIAAVASAGTEVISPNGLAMFFTGRSWSFAISAKGRAPSSALLSSSPSSCAHMHMRVSDTLT